MEIQGSAAIHAIITDECRKNRGNDGAMAEAFSRVWREYEELVTGWPTGSGVKFHVVLSVERPLVAAQQNAAHDRLQRSEELI